MYKIITLISFIYLNVCYPRNYTLSLSGTRQTLNPLFSVDANSSNINRLVHKSLIDFNKSMQLECIVCSKYEDKVINDKHYVTFWIRDNIYFHNGDKLRADDVKKSVAIFTSDIYKSIYRFAFRKIKNILVDQNKVTFIYDSYSKENITDLLLLKIVKEVSDTSNKKKIIGCGEYKVIDKKPLEVTLVNINNRFTITFKYIENNTTSILKLVNNELDGILSGVSPTKKEWILQNYPGEFLVKSVPGSTIKFININHTNKYLKHKLIRKALDLAIDKDHIIQYKLGGLAKIAQHILPEVVRMDDFVSRDRKNINRASIANKLLDASGYIKKNGVRFTLRLLGTNTRSSKEMLEIIAGYWKKIGINTIITTNEWGSYLKKVSLGNFDLAFSSWVGVTGYEGIRGLLHSAFLPPNGRNRGRYINKDMDQLLDYLYKNKLKDNDHTYNKLWSLINEDYPYILLWHENVTYLIKNDSMQLNPMPNNSMYSLNYLKG